MSSISIPHFSHSNYFPVDEDELQEIWNLFSQLAELSEPNDGKKRGTLRLKKAKVISIIIIIIAIDEIWSIR